MANEITVVTSMRAAKGDYNFARNVGEIQDDWTTAISSEGVMKVTSAGTAEAVPLGDVSSTQLGWAWFRNLSASDTVEIGVLAATTFHPLIKLAGGQLALVKLPGEK